MATKIIETENGQTVEKSGKQVKTERIIRKAQKYISTAAFVMAVTAMSSVCAFAENSENKTPTAVTSSGTMSSLIAVVMWVIRGIIVLYALPSIVKVAQAQHEGDNRERNSGLVTIAVCGLCFAATFGVEALI